jgi:septum formation protein
MKEAGFEFTIQKPDVDEDFPDDMPADQVAKFLAQKKAAFFQSKITKEIVVTADTVVILNGKILNKPDNREHAIEMLSSLSGNTHKVMTGVCIISKEKSMLFDDTTDVTFKKLTQEEIEF